MEMYATREISGSFHMWWHADHWQQIHQQGSFVTKVLSAASAEGQKWVCPKKRKALRQDFLTVLLSNST